MNYFFSRLAPRFWALLLVSLLGGTLTMSCSKDEPDVDYGPIDDALIQKYLTDNSITNAQKQPSGLYYVPVATNPSAPLATTGQVVSLLYTGRQLNGSIFDATSTHNNYPYNFTLGVTQLIAGVTEGIALMHKGDKAILLVPSGLAYGGNAVDVLPAHSVLRFDVEVTDLNVDYKIPDDTAIQKYLTDNSITNAQKQPSGLYYVPGTTNPTGTQATAGKTASVLYTGKYLYGKVFDASSQHSNVPYSFVVGSGQVIQGWDQGIALMRKGEKGQLLIPSALGYGARGSGSIPANTPLVFDVEVTDVK